MFLGVHHHSRDADNTGVRHGLAKQSVDLVAFAGRLKVVRSFEKKKRNFASFDEGLDLYGLRGLGISGPDLLVTQHHIAAIVLLDAFDDVLVRDLLAGALVDALVTHRVHRALVKPVEVDADFLGGRIQCNRHVHQPEADRSFPNCA